MVATSVAAAATAGINKRGRPYAFELLGYDFMVDDDLLVWLIEVCSPSKPVQLGSSAGLDVGRVPLFRVAALSKLCDAPTRSFPTMRFQRLRALDRHVSVRGSKEPF